MSDPLTDRGIVDLGTPITAEQAARGVLRMIDSTLVGHVDRFSQPRVAVAWIDTHCYGSLSSGERYLVDVARAICCPGDDRGARLSALGGLDLTNRRKVLMALAYLHLGHDSIPALEASVIEFSATFGETQA